MKLFIIKNLWWVTFLIALGLLISHSFKFSTLSVDTTSIFLLIILLISPFVAAIKKIKFGDFEAEIDPKEIQKIKSEAEKSIDFTPSEEIEIAQVKKVDLAIREVAETDSVLALAKIRIEIEKILQLVAKTASIELKRVSLGTLANKLANQEIISVPISNTLREVVSICNRAIHGETISEDSANTIIDLGIELIDDLYWIYKEQAVTAPIVSEKIITSDKLGEYYQDDKIYRLVTIIPLVDNPKQIVRELTQEQLNEVLESYDEYAEFIIGLTEL